MEIFVPNWTKGQLFVLCTNCLKYKNNLLSTKHRTRQNLFNTLNICPVLFYPILSSIYILQIKRYLVKNIGATFRSWWEFDHQTVLLQIPTQSIGTMLSKIAVARSLILQKMAIQYNSSNLYQGCVAIT
jgi:hypothetical protein